MTQSTITDRFQTTIPLDVREALRLEAPEGFVAVRPGPISAVMRPVPGLDELFGSIRLGRPAASTQEEKQAARNAMARDSARKEEKK